MTDYQDWQITMPFVVPPGDVEGLVTEALFEAAVEHAPAEAAGITARADTGEGRVWITFTLPNSSRDFAMTVAKSMMERVSLSAGDATVAVA